MEKIAELKRAKLLALSLLLIAVAIFITTLLLPPTPWVSALKAISEAAMVGALADWFAVVALFRRIPLPFISRHTAIIPAIRTGSPIILVISCRKNFSIRPRWWRSSVAMNLP
jgi:uncharacterized membrane-anchored protein YjiN (DUF445 family)